MYKVTLDDIVINDPHTVISNAITGTIQKEINAIDKFDFTIYPTNAGYNKLSPLRSIVEVKDILKDDELIFRGRALNVTSSMDREGIIARKVTCESELAYLCDTIAQYHYYSRVYKIDLLSDLLNNHNSQTTSDKQILLGEVTGGVEYLYDVEIGYVSTWNTIAAELEGEIRLRYANGKRYLDYTSSQFSKGTSTSIELAVNMTMTTQKLDPSKVVTVCHPLGDRIGDNNERVEGAPAYSNVLRREYGDIHAVKVFDNVTSRIELHELAEKYLANQKPIKKQYQVEAVDLSLVRAEYESFELGSIYHIVNPLIGLDDDIRCIKQTISIEDRLKNKLTFGDKFETLTKNMVSSNASITRQMASDRRSESSLIHNVVDNQTALIRGADGGYKYDRLDSNGKPIETFYLNSPDITTATAALRINQNGIGFWKSSDGGTALDGPYTSAWTIDGVFNTNFILAQTLTGVKINNGSGTFTVDDSGNVTANSLLSNNATITGGSIHISTSAETYDAIELHNNEWTSSLSPLQLTLDNNTIGGHVILQAGAMYFKWNNDDKIVINSSTGNISSYSSGLVFHLDTNGKTLTMAQGTVWADDVYVKGSGGGYISVRDYILNHP